MRVWSASIVTLVLAALVAPAGAARVEGADKQQKADTAGEKPSSGRSEAKKLLWELKMAELRESIRNPRHPHSGIMYGINRVLAFQQLSWNDGEMDDFMEGYWKSDELRFASGNTITTGWEAVRDRYMMRYGSGDTMGRLTYSNRNYTVLGLESAVVTGSWKIERADDVKGGLFTLLFRFIEGRWVIVYHHTSSE